MIEIFKTNIQNRLDASKLKDIILKEFPDVQIHFDLEDCDKIMRAEGEDISTNGVIQLVKHYGYSCEILE